MERAIVLCQGDEIQVADLPPKLRRQRPDPTAPSSLPKSAAPEAMLPLDEVERRYILQVLNAVGGRRAEAARILQVDRKTLYRKLERWSREANAVE